MTELVNLLVYGFGLGLTLGVPFGIAKVYRKTHWLSAGMAALLGVALIAGSMSSGTINFDFNPVFLVTSTPTYMASEALTAKVFRNHTNSSKGDK